jgi:D-aminoacyl-tRNA deacylase
VRVVLQRVAEARVRVGEQVRGEIGLGLVVLAGFAEADDAETTRWMAEKVRELRIFADDEGRMNRSVEEVGGELLIISQFTLYGDARRGRRPSFAHAARPEIAIPLYESFVDTLRKLGSRVATGEFGAMMRVELVNDGPVTLILER